MSDQRVAVNETPGAGSIAQPEAPLNDLSSRQWRYRVGMVLVGLLLLGAWELLPRLGIVAEIVLPPFTDTIYSLYTLVITDFFLRHFLVTLNEVFWGFLIAVALGFGVGVLLAVVEPLKRTTYPYVVGFQAIPKIVLAPLLVSWFGYGQSSKVAMAAVIGFFPVLINTMVGIESVPEEMVRLMRSLRASKAKIFRKVSLPNATPLIFAGVKTALTFALIGAIVGEFVGASAGLGYLLDTYNFQLRIDRVFAIIIILSTIGATFFFALEWLDRKLIVWRHE